MSFFGPNTVTILVAAACTAAVLGAGGALTEIGPWYGSLRRPSFQPPNWLFGPAWTAIGVLTAWAAVDAWVGAPDGAAKTTIIVLFAVNGLLNIGWSLLFFKLRRPDWALIEVVPLWLSIAALIVAFAPFAGRACWLLAPYLVWVGFAAYLNRAVVELNRPFGRISIRRQHQ